MTRRMADPEFRAAQLRDVYAPHVKPVNKLVDELRVDERRWAPHVAPLHAGVMTRLLLVVGDPGPAPDTGGRPYEGMIGVEGDDAVSARLGALLRRAGVDVADTTVWPAFPWYVDHPASAGELRQGADILRRLLEQLEALEVVVLLGRGADRTWRNLTSTWPDDVPFVHVLTTHDVDETGWAGTNAQRHAWREEQADVLAEAARLLRGD